MKRRPEQVLALIEASPTGLSRAEIAAALKIAPGTVSVYVDELHKFGKARPTGIGRFSRWVKSEPMVHANSVFSLGGK